MTITTLAIGASITPIVIKTFFKHYLEQARKSREDRHTEASDEILFRETFAIVRKFCQIATHDTVDSLQSFTNTHVPSPPSATVIGVLIPLSSCDNAARILIEYFGPDDLQNVVGGEKWWQVRSLAGIEAEWIAQTSDWNLGKHVEREMAREEQKYQGTGNGTATAIGGEGGGARPQGKPDLQAAAQRARWSEKSKHTKRHNAKMSKRAGNWKDHTVGRIVRVVHNNRDGAAAAQAKQEGGKDAQGCDSGPAWEEVDLDGNEFDENAFAAFENLDRLKRVLLYCHGGAYYWGSINTHRYQIIRYARKFGGRAFAVNYRKAPNQYPWPCPLHDLLAAYLYLIRPPPEAKHKAVDPAHLVLAGDSAGGGMSLALLTLLRDMDLPMPAGAVLISPWCDMTHSFPSILQNIDTDIIPPYGFIHKPSTLWPVFSTAPEATAEDNTGGDGSKKADPPPVKGQQDVSQTICAALSSTENSHAVNHDRSKKWDIPGEAAEDVAMPSTPKFLYSDPIEIRVTDPEHKKEWGDKIVVKGQIQQYATNAQLGHPLCSPILHGSLGGLPPLYILAGNGEVLRDEIIYLAHRAARPMEYPLSEYHLQRRPRSRDSMKKYDSKPTKVHFQLFDEMCHVLTVFSFTTQAKYAYRAISSFVKHVTGAPTSYIDPFPDFHQDQRLKVMRSETHSSSLNLSVDAITLTNDSTASAQPGQQEEGAGSSSSAGLMHVLAQLHISDIASDAVIGGSCTADSPTTMTPVTPLTPNRTPSPRIASAEPHDVEAADDIKLTAHQFEQKRKATLREGKRRLVSLGVQNEYSGAVPLLRPSFQEYMIRERVDIRGKIRPMEPEEHFAALQLPPDEIGIIKEGPAVRYMTGQRLWAKKFKSEAKRVAKRKAQNEAKALCILRRAAQRGLLNTPNHGVAKYTTAGRTVTWTTGMRYGPMDLSDETPPPSAIAGRRDTEDALALLQTSLRARAKLGGTTPTGSTGAPKQSGAEKEHRKRPAGGGIRLWTSAMNTLHRKKVHVDPMSERQEDEGMRKLGERGRRSRRERLKNRCVEETDLRRTADQVNHGGVK
ncbi:alpha/beta-hydrolase [Tilletiaria anomala UBC 951]|uniref:Alpha/beta-hydrolase n=1 Tax=Tilletiaria anomala (strain ATCC 24038 / CBS 436.72 / UBC 951) TaxID=1037660 RepID=A0A066VGE7_TILAU|nr:alpha/beta-hydrolase [Tilletiaria anomala UBC 951]KDN37665.1 alpha/beta-hydrolase [Tilletiaria anomala UBC 951]